MGNVFISYRRGDTAGYAGRLADSLEPFLGSGKVFRDVEDIHPGDDFVKTIEQNLQNAAVVLIVIGKDWITAKDDQGIFRLNDPKDFVRLEIEMALRHNQQIIPVLVDNAIMPKPKELPEAIAPIAYRQAIEIADSRWDEDINRLLRLLAISQKEKETKVGLSGWLALKSKGFRKIALPFTFLFASCCLYLMAHWYFVVTDFSGNWYFKDGDYLLIKQDKNYFEVEHIDPGMQTTYDKGKGTIKGSRLRFDLEPLYSTNYRYRGDLELSWDEKTLKGILVEILSNETIPIELNRTNPAKKVPQS